MPTASSSSATGRPAARAPSWLRPSAGVLLIALIFLAPLAIGTVHEWTRALVFALAAVLLALTLTERWLARKRVPITAPFIALCVAVVATALQLIPLPASVLRVLSPQADEVFSTTLGDYGAHALSLDPAGTWGELAKLAAYAAFFLSAVIYASRSGRRRQLMIAVAGAATLVALVGFAQAAVDSHKLLFVYEPISRGVNEVLVRGTFVNGNHFGALMCIGAPCALAIGLREPEWRVPAFAATIVLNVGAVLSLSRAAMITAPLAQLITFGFERWQQRQGARRGSTGSAFRVVLALAIVGAIGVTVAVAASRVKPALNRTAAIELEDPFGDPRSKFYTWTSSAAMAMDYRWTGAGRGAYEQAFTQVYDRGGMVRFPWVENGYLQALTDWGAPVALLLLVLAVWSLLIAMKRLDPDPLAAGALGAILALAVHEGADFAVELPGVALPALAILATLFSRRGSEPEPGRRMVATRPVWLLAPAAVLVVALIALRTPRAEAAALELRRDLRDGKQPIAELLPRAEQVRDEHPADFYLHLIVAERLAREHNPAAMAWLNDALYLNPSHPGPHLMAAELLSASGHRAQALLEYRAAVALHPGPRLVWDRVAARWPELDALLAATPQDDPRLLAQLGRWLVAHKRNEDAEAVFDKALVLDPHEVPVLQELTRLALVRNDAKAARAHAKVLAQLDDSPPTRLLLARTSLAEGDLAGVAKQLDDVIDRSPRTFEVELQLALAYSARGSRDLARSRLERLGWATSGPQRIKLHETAAEIERRAGNSHQYEWEMEQANRLKKKDKNVREDADPGR
jgi:Tfp pilus assembly protein PilF